MKIGINANRIDGPWGGGNRFVANLENSLVQRGHEVHRRLVPNLDLILLMAVQPKLRITSFTPRDAADYCRVYPRTAVVLRVNTCDQQRATDAGINRQVIQASEVADHTVFVSQFMRDLYLRDGFPESRPYSVILTGANTEVFHPRGSNNWDPARPLRLVTHHWSTGVMKGYDIYERLDTLLCQDRFRHQFEFTHIGRLPLGLELPNSRVLPVLDGDDLARELKRHHVHITGARHEPGGNHYIEAMQCGLPVLFLRSGGTPEYCRQYGIEFSPADFEEKLLSLPGRYGELRSSVMTCHHNARAMCDELAALFDTIVQRKQKLTSRGNLSATIAGRINLTARSLRRAVRKQRQAG